MTLEIRTLLAEQIKATAKALTAQLMAQSVREKDPDAFIFGALARLNELSPVDKDVDAIAKGLDQFAQEYGLTVPAPAGQPANAAWMN